MTEKPHRRARGAENAATATGASRCYFRREGWSVNRTKTYRLYREQGLVVRRRKRQRIGLAGDWRCRVPIELNESWLIDYAPKLGTARANIF